MPMTEAEERLFLEAAYRFIDNIPTRQDLDRNEARTTASASASAAAQPSPRIKVGHFDEEVSQSGKEAIQNPDKGHRPLVVILALDWLESFTAGYKPNYRVKFAPFKVPLPPRNLTSLLLRVV